MRAPVVWVAAAAAGAAALGPACVFAVEYLSVEQAQRVLFPQADRFESRALDLSPAQQQTLQARLGGAWHAPRWKGYAALRDGQPLGWVVTDEVVGKFELIGYAVALDTSGTVRQIEILSYRESHGHEVRLAPWRRQFVGKKAEDPIQVGRDIANISGATLSCTHVTEGVRRIVLAMELLRGARPASGAGG